MTASAGPNFGLTYGYASLDPWDINPDFARLDALGALHVLSAVLATPPGSPAAGDRYIVAATATGAWAGQETKIARYHSSWEFYAPPTGLLAFDGGSSRLFRFTGSVWKTVPGITDSVSAAGTNQETAAVLADQINVITSASAGQGVNLGGASRRIINRSPLAIPVYPEVGAQIESLGTNAAFTLPVNWAADFVQSSATLYRVTSMSLLAFSSATATLSALASAATSGQALAANSSRIGVIVYNSDSNAVLLKYGTTASASSFTVRIAGGGHWSMPQPVYTGRIDVIWEADGAGSLYITEQA